MNPVLYIIILMDSNTREQLDHIKKWIGTGSINFFGRQYSGKDTQCVKLAENIEWCGYWRGGDILRNTELPAHVKEVIDAGHLSPTEEFRRIVTPYLKNPEFQNHPLLLSTVGRMKGEETVVYDAAKQSGHEIKAVIVLDVSEETVWQRYHAAKESSTRGIRVDDKEDALKRRLLLFEESTVKVIEWYRKKGIVIEIDGEQNTSDVYKNDIRTIVCFL